MTTPKKLFKRTTTGKIQQWNLEVNPKGDGYRTISGQQGGKLVTSAWTICKGKNVGRANETTPQEQVQSEVAAHYKKKSERGYTESVKNVDKASLEFAPMLAKNYDDVTLTFPVFSQPKLDGMRCNVGENGPMSRGNKPILAAKHLAKLYEAAKKYCNTKDIVIDGELYNHELKHDFNKIISLCKKGKPTAEDFAACEEQIQYWVYDIYFPSDKTLPFSCRSEILKEFVEDLNDPNVVFVPTTEIQSQAELDAKYAEYAEQEFEGQMVRLDAKYEMKRTKSLLKRKEFTDEEFVILDIVEGKGNRAGMAGYATFKRGAKDFKANIMGDRAFLKDLLANKNKHIGSEATVVYFNITPDGAPRFPRVKTVWKGKRNV